MVDIFYMYTCIYSDYYYFIFHSRNNFLLEKDAYAIEKIESAEVFDGNERLLSVKISVLYRALVRALVMSDDQIYGTFFAMAGRGLSYVANKLLYMCF